MSDTTPPPTPLITKNTGLSVGIVVLLCGPLIWAVTAEQRLKAESAAAEQRLSFELQALSRDQERNTERIMEMQSLFLAEFSELKADIAGRTRDRLPRSVQAQWIELMKARNAGKDIVWVDLPEAP